MQMEESRDGNKRHAEEGANDVFRGRPWVADGGCGCGEVGEFIEAGVRRLRGGTVTF